jgi:hypothetical protein
MKHPPNKKQIAAYERNTRYNHFYRRIDEKLARCFTHEERVAIMERVFPVVQEVAGAVMKRTIDDLTQASGNLKLACAIRE